MLCSEQAGSVGGRDERGLISTNKHYTIHRLFHQDPAPMRWTRFRFLFFLRSSTSICERKRRLKQAIKPLFKGY